MENKRKRPRRRKADKKLDTIYSSLRATKTIIEQIEDIEKALEEL